MCERKIQKRLTATVDVTGVFSPDISREMARQLRLIAIDLENMAEFGDSPVSGTFASNGAKSEYHVTMTKEATA